MNRLHTTLRTMRRLGWVTLIAFTVKGVVSTSLIAWALWSTTGVA